VSYFNEPLVRPLTVLIDDWIPSVGVTIKERERIQEATIAASGDQKIAWIDVLDSIGDRTEVLLLLELGNSHDQKQLRAVSNSQFLGIRWGGMLPHLERWLRDPIIAGYALKFFTLSHTSGGRDLLVAFLSDTTQSASLRIKAVEQLTQTMAGIDLLATTCAEAQFTNMLDDLLDLDNRKHLAAERIKINDYYGNELWNELIDGLDAEYMGDIIRRRSSDECRGTASRTPATLRPGVARLLPTSVRQNALTTQSEWRKWFEADSQDAVILDDLLRLVLDHPKLIENPAVWRRIVPYKLSRIPQKCIPLYRQMLQSDNGTIQYLTCKALLSFSDSADSVNVAIDMIDLSKPRDDAPVNSGTISMLRRRFAVNFFWDTAAWRKWANDAHLTSPALPE
jgi:hypothetical protein